MFSKLSLRFRMLLFFLLLACAVPVVMFAALMFAGSRLEGNPVPPLVLAGGMATIALVLLILVVWQLFDTHITQPIMAVSRDLQTLLHANPEHSVRTDGAKYLGPLAATIDDVARSIRAAKAASADQIAAAVDDANAQRRQLEAIVRDLREGVIVCNRFHEVLLFNGRALEIAGQSSELGLPGETGQAGRTGLAGRKVLAGELGLARSLFDVMDQRPVITTLERLTNRWISRRHETHPHGLTAPFTFATREGTVVLHGQMTLMTTQNDMLVAPDGESTETPQQTSAEAIKGYVLTFDDRRAETQQSAELDRLLRSTLEDLQNPVERIVHEAAALKTASTQDTSEDLRNRLHQLADLAEQTHAQLEQATAAHRAVPTIHWPVSDVFSANLLSIVESRFRDNPVITCDVTGEAIWLRCDAHQIVEALSSLIVKVAEDVGTTTFALEALDDVPRPYVSLVFKGSPAHAERIDVWGDQVLPGLKPPLTLRDALKSHRSELQLREIGDGRVRLGFELLSPMEKHTDLGAVSPIKPLDFYDFKLLERAAPGAADHDTPLSDATFVVFDTETTGLEPSKGDEIISIAGVRVVNGRILMGETFDTLVNPGRSIPARSTAVHGITDSMVKDALPISVQLKRFHRFVGDSILVAHNAPFDLRFLDLKKDATGVRFDGPVLDTVLLSAIVHDHTDQHTLDAVAERFGVTLPPDKRHTALGDAMATADVFVRMIDLLRFNGITTLKQAMEASQRLQNIRRKQSKY